MSEDDLHALSAAAVTLIASRATQRWVNAFTCAVQG
jgi:hypothetical protein